MENTRQVAVATVLTPGGKVSYAGNARIDGVPGSHAPIPLEFRDTAGSSCGALLPTGNAADEIDGVCCTLIDNGMPCVVLKAADVGASGYESREELESGRFARIRERIEAIRLTACLIDGSPANEVAEMPYGARKTLSIEHPTGEMSCVLEINDASEVASVALLRTARKLMDGEVFV